MYMPRILQKQHDTWTQAWTNAMKAQSLQQCHQTQSETWKTAASN